MAAVETITLAPAVKGHQTTIKLKREPTSSFIECFRKEEEKQKKEHKAFATRQIGLFDLQKLSSIYNWFVFDNLKIAIKNHSASPSL